MKRSGSWVRAVVVVLAAAALCRVGSVYAGEALEINGAFLGKGSARGWNPNRPGHWDAKGQMTVREIPGVGKNAVRLTSVSRGMHLYASGQQFPAKRGDKVIVRGLMRGQGAGLLGIYYYPAGGWRQKEFLVSDDWSEFAAELVVPEGAKTIRIVIGVPPRASIEFLDLSATLGEGGPAAVAAAETDLGYPVYPLAKPPVMDGRWDDKAWKDMPAAAGFTSIRTGALVPLRPTSFKMGWHGDDLYVAVRCEEPEPGKIKADPDNYRKGWYQDDNLEFFFTADPEGPPKQFVANSRGAQWSNIDAAKAASWTVRAARGPDHWGVEMRIPFSLLGIDGDVRNKPYRFNLGRAAYGNPVKEQQLSCFAPVIGAFNQANSFPELTVRETAPTPGLLARDRQRLDRLGPWLRERLWKAANVRERFLAKREGDAGVAAFAGLKQEAGAMLESGDLAKASAFVYRYEALKTEFGAPAKAVVLEVDARDVTNLAIWLNAVRAAGTNGTWPVRLGEGMSVIGMTATVGGKAPGLRVRIPGQPELARRWRVGTVTDDAWKAAGFDDRAWPVAVADKDGYLAIPGGLTGKVCFRQLTIWSENHYSNLRCLEPKVREWGFSEKSMETLFHTLYAPPPLAFPLADYEFILDVPKAFRLLEQDLPDDARRGKLNRRPQSVTTEATTHDGQPYTRYRFAFDSAFVQPDTFQCTLIPLILGEYDGAARSCTFFFRRLASGNLTELEQTLPVRILPPLDGRMPKKVMLSQYCAEPFYTFSGGKLFPEHFERHMQQSLDVGFNYWILKPTGKAYTKKVYDRVLERDGVVVFWGPGNYPIWGRIKANWALGKLMLATPEMRVRFFNEAERVTKPIQFCRSFATGAGADRFREAVKKDLGMMLHGSAEHKLLGFPKATIYWNDWERTPWETKHRRFCFCDNCKGAFRQYAKLPDDADLSDKAIEANYAAEWKQFRCELDGRANGLVKQACNELGLQYMYYDMVRFADNWPPLKGRIDLAFPGWPGSGQAVGLGPHDGVGTFPVNQQALDRQMTFLREKVGMSRATGQMFAAGAYGLKKPLQAWPQDAIIGRDGFANPARLKPQILRVVASFHGGVDLCNSMDRCAGQSYYIAEATRAISDFEDLFYDGERADHLAASAQTKYPNLLVLVKGDERLVLLFNEGGSILNIELTNKDVKPGQKATVWGVPGKIATPANMKVTIPPDDVTLVHIR